MIEREFRKWVGKKENPNMVRIEDAVPKIIDKELWNRVQERRKDKKGRSSNKAKRTYLLTGMITCHNCGRTYMGQTVHNKKGYETRYYVCGRKKRTRDCKPKNINADKIEKFVVKSLKDFLLNTDFTAAAQLVAEAYNSYRPELTEERRELKEVNKQIENGINTILSGMIFPELEAKINELRRRKEELEAYISKQEQAAPEPITPEMVIDHMKKSLHELDENNLKILIKKHIKKIEAYDDGSYTVIVVLLTNGAPNWARTSDPLINSQMLCQLSYGSKKSGSVLLSREVALQVPSTLLSLTSVFGMGTGGASMLLPPDYSSFPLCQPLADISPPLCGDNLRGRYATHSLGCLTCTLKTKQCLM